ncbi:hypothetical protein [uncultured Campylobacter sp.]|nr:hypothetical protein [uncultured Campylobacter sp.]
MIIKGAADTRRKILPTRTYKISNIFTQAWLVFLVLSGKRLN